MRLSIYGGNKFMQHGGIMNKVVFLLVLGVLIFSGCSANKSTSNQHQDIPVASDKGVKNKAADKNTISDLSSWDHPVKQVFENNKIVISKVELINQKTYPIFYVKFPFDLDYSYAHVFKAIIDQIATANTYWDFKIIDEDRNTSVEVLCDKSLKEVKEIIVNGNVGYFNELLEKGETVDNECDKVTYYLMENVPEIDEFRESLDKYSREQNDKVNLVMRLESEPDPKSSDEFSKYYYSIYVGENHDTRTVRWNTFLVHENLKEILIYDIMTDDYISLEKWRGLQ